MHHHLDGSVTEHHPDGRIIELHADKTIIHENGITRVLPPDN